MKQQIVNITLPENPEFQSVLGLSNTTFDGDNVVNGRGATEDQLKTIHDQCAEVSERLDTIENSNTLNDILQVMRSDIEDIRTTIENCCYTLLAGSAEWDGTTSDGADVSVNIAWDADPMTNGGRMTAVSSSGAGIAMYYFLVQKGDGIFLKMKAANYAGYIVAVTDTGAITVTEGSGAATDKIIAGATDANGCEGLQTFPATAAPWYAPPT